MNSFWISIRGVRARRFETALVGTLHEASPLPTLLLSLSPSLSFCLFSSQASRLLLPFSSLCGGNFFFLAATPRRGLSTDFRAKSPFRLPILQLSFAWCVMHNLSNSYQHAERKRLKLILTQNVLCTLFSVFCFFLFTVLTSSILLFARGVVPARGPATVHQVRGIVSRDDAPEGRATGFLLQERCSKQSWPSERPVHLARARARALVCHICNCSVVATYFSIMQKCATYIA